MIKYFKDPNGNCGVFDDQETTVPHPIIEKSEYDLWVSNQPHPQQKDLSLIHI